MNVDEMATQFKTIEEMQAYCNSQFRTLTQMVKKLNAAEEEVIHLKKLLANSGSLIKDPTKKIELYQDCSDQQAICHIELKKLKDLSIERELSLEEAKRTEIYTKLLISLTEKPKLITEPSKRLDDAQLLALLQNEPEASDLQH